jgi:aryl-alcohol dehydrogenase-like predicted oxidoreductase
VSYSLVDRRPEVKMVPFCRQHDIKLLTYGTLLGGFLSDRYARALNGTGHQTTLTRFSARYLGRPEPQRADLTTSSLNKYYPFIRSFGGWALFQELLRCLRTVADRHQVSIANVAVRWVLDRPQVGGVIVGARLGLSEHIEENKR